MGAFEDWYVAEHPRLLFSMTAVCGDLRAAEEVAAEACARALARWERVGGMDNPTGWTYVVALNLVRRSRRTRPQAEVRGSVDRVADPATGADTRLDVLAALARLPDRARTATVLRYYGGMTEREVADAMGVAPGTVAATLSSARRRLAELLAAPSDEESRHG